MVKKQMENDFLDKHVFYELQNLNDGFDSPSIKYFSATEFETILNRVKELGLGVYGIEPWKDGRFYGAETYENHADNPADYNWYFKVFEEFKKKDEDLQYSASYYILKI